MKIFVVMSTVDYETYQTFEGAFTTKEKAEEFVDKMFGNDTYKNKIEIQEVELDSMKRRM